MDGGGEGDEGRMTVGGAGKEEKGFYGMIRRGLMDLKCIIKMAFFVSRRDTTYVACVSVCLSMHLP